MVNGLYIFALNKSLRELCVEPFGELRLSRLSRQTLRRINLRGCGGGSGGVAFPASQADETGNSLVESLL
jgi:hypothetical protein